MATGVGQPVGGRVRSAPVVSAAVAALAGIPAGPQLAAALAQLTPSTLTGYETVLVLRARRRQVNHEQAMLLAAVDEVLRRDDPGFGRVDEAARGEWLGVDEVRAALVLTRPGAKSLCDLTTDLVTRLPAVFAAMRAGVLDEARGRVFSAGTEGLRPAHRQAIVEALLPRAPRLTVSQLADEIRKAAIELDPESFRRRHERGLARRRVEGRLNPDGTGCLAGHNLPAEQVHAAWDRLDAFARRLKQAGHPDPVRTLQADMFGALLDGSLAGLDDEEILDRLLARVPASDGDRADDGAADDGAAGDGVVDDGSAHDGAADGGGGVDPADLGDGGSAAGVGRAPDGVPGADPVSGCPASGDGVAVSRVRGRGLRLVVALGTLAGRDRRPAMLLGLGFVHAELARRISATPGAVWRYVLTGPNRTLLDVGVIRGRPTRPWAVGPAPGGDGTEVWLEVTRDELAGLCDDPPPGWEPLLTELVRRIATSRGGPPVGDPRARYPSAELRRWIQIRDRYCTFPGCRVPAHHSEVDHLHDYARGGPTIAANLGLASAGCHAAKTRNGWVAYATEPGHITWRSPLGHEYPPDAHLGDAPDEYG